MTTLTINDLPILVDLLERTPAVLARLRVLLELDVLDRVPDRLDRIESILQELTESQKRREEGLIRLEATAQKLTDGQAELRQMTAEMAKWRRGEEGHRVGEIYERQILRRAANLFYFGEGGSPETDKVSTHLLNLLRQNPLASAMSPDQDPFLADVIWWKIDRYAVVEVSVKVDSNDIQRAARRAKTMRASGVDTLPVVIGEAWARPLEHRKEAESLAVAWKVGNELSLRLIEYRKLAG